MKLWPEYGSRRESNSSTVISRPSISNAVSKSVLKGITRDGLDYEFTVVFDLDIKHLAEASKDRTGLFMDQPEEVITSAHGKKILEWCNSGISLSEIKSEISKANTVEKHSLLKLLAVFGYPVFSKVIHKLLENFNNAFLAIEKLSQRVTFLLNSEYITGCE